MNQRLWLALAIGNSRLHWARFQGDRLEAVWHTSHIAEPAGAERWLADLIGAPLIIASVVPTQAALWQSHPQARLLSLTDIPIAHLYPTLGIDRALTLWAALQTIGGPVLVIDAGTALTFTGGHAQGFLGGAILPGVALQFQSLGQGTAALPSVTPDAEVPPRWAVDTDAAIASGIFYTVTAGIQSFCADWLRQFPDSAIVLTGGDGDRLYPLLDPILADRIRLEPNLVFQGIQAIVALDK